MHRRHFLLMAALSNPGCAVNQREAFAYGRESPFSNKLSLPSIHTNACQSSSTPARATPLKLTQVFQPSKLQSLILPADWLVPLNSCSPDSPECPLKPSLCSIFSRSSWDQQTFTRISLRKHQQLICLCSAKKL